MGLVQAACAGSPLDRQQPLNHLLQGAFLVCGMGGWGQGRRPEKAGRGSEKGGPLPQARGRSGVKDGHRPPQSETPGFAQQLDCSPSLARSTARFTRLSRASQSSWLERRVGSRCRRPCSTDSSWADAGEQLTWGGGRVQVSGHPLPGMADNYWPQFTSSIHPRPLHASGPWPSACVRVPQALHW